MGVPFVHDVKLSELKIRFVATFFWVMNSQYGKIKINVFSAFSPN